MDTNELLEQIQTPAEAIIQSIRENIPLPPFGLIRSARLPFIATLKLALDVPVLFLTDRYDRSLALSNELGFWISKEKQGKDCSSNCRAHSTCGKTGRKFSS